MRRTLTLLVVAVVLTGTAYGLHTQGRPWLCSCGYVLPWSGDASSSDTSQHLLDPYGFTHVLHGFVFYGVLARVAPSLALSLRLALAVALEGLWEIVENSEFVIRRYREGTAAPGYEGDAIVNALGDMSACGLEFLLAYRLGARRALVVFAVTEVVLLVWIGDSLLPNVPVLIYPVEEIKAWQTGF